MEGKGFFGTVLGCITAVAGLITAVGGLIAILYQADIIGAKKGDPAPVVSSSLGGGSSLSEEELRSKQARLDQLIQQAEQKLASGTAAAEEMDAGYGAVPVQIANVAGFWRGVSGINYSIQQQGGVLALQETNPLFGGVITAVGSGTIEGPNLTFAVTTAAGTNGTAYLRLSPDGSQLAGQYQDAVTGMVVPLQLFR